MVVHVCPTLVVGSYERFLFGFQAPGADRSAGTEADASTQVGCECS